MTKAEIRKTFPAKADRLIENLRLNDLAHKECKRREKVLKDYLNSNRVKRLERAVQDACDRLNQNIAQWNDIILEDYKEDPKSW